MSARQDILRSIQAAVGGAESTFVDVPRGYRTAAPPIDGDDLIALFVERVTDYRAIVSRCGEADVPDTIRAALADTNRVVVPADFPYPVDDSVTDSGLSASDLDAVDAVITTAAAGIALTSTIVLDHGRGQGRRAVSLVPDRHVCLIRTDQIVHGVPDAVARLDPTRPQT